MTLLALVWLGAVLTGGATAAEEFAVEAVLTELNRPCGVEVRPGGTADRYELFVAESGAGRVVRWSHLAADRVAEVVTGFVTNSAAEPFQQTGPLAVSFLDPGLLIVGAPPDESLGPLRVFELREDNAALSADAADDRSAGMLPSESGNHDGGCHSVTRTLANEYVPDTLILAVRASRGGSILYKSRVQAGVLGPLQAFVPRGIGTGSTAAMSIATSSTGRIVVATGSSANDNDGARLVYYNPITAAAELDLSLDLPQVVALVRSPITGSLYAANFGDANDRGGIYRIDDASEPARPACVVVKVATIHRPTALAFAPDGALYVTTFGDGDDDGTLAVVTGDL